MYDDLTRQKQADFVDYAKDGTALLVPKGNPDNIAGWPTWPARKSVARRAPPRRTNLAKLNEKFKADGKAEMTISEYPDQPAALLAMQSGKIDADLTDASTGWSESGRARRPLPEAGAASHPPDPPLATPE